MRIYCTFISPIPETLYLCDVWPVWVDSIFDKIPEEVVIEAVGDKGKLP